MIPYSKDQRVWLLDANFRWISADLLVGECARCKAIYYPDTITRKSPGRKRVQELEYDAEYLRVSKHGVWVHRKIAEAQEAALLDLRSGWSRWADWINRLTKDVNVKFTYRQSQRLFMEHFCRRLLVSHGKSAGFTCEAHPPTRVLAELVRERIGKNGGVIARAMTHGCKDCTHVKRYRVVGVGDEQDEGGDSTGIAGFDSTADMETPLPPNTVPQPLPPNLPQALPQQEAPPPGSPRGHVRLGVMDGKTFKHKKCALPDCEGPLVNFKNGRFCQTHLDHESICGILACGRPTESAESLTCNDQAHKDWYKQYEQRFLRLSFPGVKRVIRRQNQDAADEENPDPHGPTLQVNLPALGNTPGQQVVHTFKARSIYCIETIQWACGFPIGWGKCYRGEGPSQVLSFINKVWEDYPEARPNFIVYDKACELLRHIVTQNPSDAWLNTTKFIVDAWHYISHKAGDVLCRTWCNPAPKDGSQPDLVLTEVDDNGTAHQTRAFNTETAEQFNSWLNGFEAQARQMTDVNFDLYIHVLMMLYMEKMEETITRKDRWLTEDFLDAVNGLTEDI
ncbi:hypothetical protein R3P38DRAFT_3268154 [Favolaschia claudopus]|uniref:CxC6 like cysteine cluster associated with KDZ domain-containing protein n=1 Tax=Favolaschia claudopus TaxID=2862362 RepID=A0AAW0BIF0_9AGAR